MLACLTFATARVRVRYRRIFFVGVLPLCGTEASTKAYLGATLALVSTIYFRELTPYRVE